MECDSAEHTPSFYSQWSVLAEIATPAPVSDTWILLNFPKVDLVSPEGGLLLEPGITAASLGHLVPFDLDVSRLGSTDVPKVPDEPSTAKKLVVDLRLI